METIKHLLQDEGFLVIGSLLILVVIYLIIANNVTLIAFLRAVRIKKRFVPRMENSPSPPTDRDYNGAFPIEVVQKACEKYAITCEYDHDRFEQKPTEEAIPLVFYVKTAHGTAYIRTFVTAEFINDTKAIDGYLQESVLKVANEMVNEKVEKDKILKMLEQEGFDMENMFHGAYCFPKVGKAAIRVYPATEKIEWAVGFHGGKGWIWRHSNDIKQIQKNIRIAKSIMAQQKETDGK